jgi:hypothetical protein
MTELAELPPTDSPPAPTRLPGDRVKVVLGRYAGRLGTVSRVTPGGLVEVALDSLANAGVGIVAVRSDNLQTTTKNRPRVNPQPLPIGQEMGVKIPPRREIPRDRFGRPMIVPPGGGDRVPYRRVTTHVGALDSKEGLMKWQQRQLAIGLSRRADLILAASAVDAEAALAPARERGPSSIEAAAELDEIIAKATEPSSAASTVGSALHRLTERVDRGEKLGKVPEPFADDIEAYIEATRGIKWTQVECFRVFDPWQIAGTADRVGWYRGRLVVGDTKTGSIDYPLKISMQISLYAHSVGYDIATDTRAEPDEELDLSTGLVVHLPAGQGRCDLYEVDLERGWEACQLAKQVWDWRSAKGLLAPVGDAVIADAVAPDFAEQARTAPDIEALRGVWYGARDAGALTPDIREVIETRRGQLVTVTQP